MAEFAALFAQSGAHALAEQPWLGLQAQDYADVARAMFKAVGQSPASVAKHCGTYMAEMIKVFKGVSSIQPDPKDRRFADPAWQEHAVYKRLMQAYLTTHSELHAYIDHTTLDERDKARAHFFASLVTDALSPSNGLLTHPGAVRKTIVSGGDNLVQGLRHFLHDLQHNHGMPSQVDATPFQVGVNVATSAGQVIHRSEVFELIQYTPTRARVHRRPLLMSPPQVNKFYAVDLAPEKSLVQWCNDAGIQLYLVSWRNPDVTHRDWGLDTYVRALDEAVDVTREVSGSPDVNMWGSCSGGLTLAAYLGVLAARGERKVAATCWAVCVLDTRSGLARTTLGLLQTPALLRAARAHSHKKGVVDGNEMAALFAWLRPNDLVWNYWVNNYLMGNPPSAFDILAWNNDTTRLPAQFHSDLIDMMEANPFAQAHALTVCGESIDMGEVDVDAYVVGGITDHITPWQGCYGTARILGERSTFVLANAGHLQSLINPPGTPKAWFAAAPATAADPLVWSQSAPRVEGSWWPHWRSWMQERSGELVPAPKKPGSRRHRPLAPAPGTYVLQK